MNLLSLFSNEPSLARHIGAHPRRGIHAFADGATGRIVGSAGQMEEKQIAPLTGRACAAWYVRVSGARSYTKANTPVIEAQGMAPFTVSDATGQAIVRADDASLLLEFDVTETLGLSRQAPPRLRRFLREHSKEGRRVDIDWRPCWQEGILAEGQRVAILGRGRRETDPEAAEGSYREAATRLVMTRVGREDLFISTFAGSLGGQATFKHDA